MVSGDGWEYAKGLPGASVLFAIQLNMLRCVLAEGKAICLGEWECGC